MEKSIASLDTTIAMIRSIALGGVVLFCLVGIDLLIGGRMMNLLGKVFNKRFDVDSLVLTGLASFHKGSEKKMMNVDEAMQQSRARMFMGVMLLIPAVLLVVLVLTRR